MMPVLPSLLAEIDDLGQVIFVIVALVVGFIQWVIKVLREKAEAAERRRHVPSLQEQEAQRRAWAEQARHEASTPEQPDATGSGWRDLLGEFRKAMEEAQSPPVPPPLPMPARPAAAPAAAHTAIARPAPPLPVIAPRSVPEIQALPTVTLSQRQPHRYTALLHTMDGYRQAFVLREIIGPPRGLHSYEGPDD
ncbi:MAG: hypothetical protein ACOYMN_15770 [Roseimicrobium sp.]